jgi:hypothetical protein
MAHGLGHKTILIVASNKGLAERLKRPLEEVGAKVIFSDYSPHNESETDKIIKEALTHQPKVDAVILHSGVVKMEQIKNYLVAIVKGLKGSKPVIIYRDSSDKQLDKLQLRDAGAAFMDYNGVDQYNLAYEVGAILTRHRKVGQKHIR